MVDEDGEDPKMANDAILVSASTAKLCSSGVYVCACVCVCISPVTRVKCKGKREKMENFPFLASALALELAFALW